VADGVHGGGIGSGEGICQPALGAAWLRLSPPDGGQGPPGVGDCQEALNANQGLDYPGWRPGRQQPRDGPWQGRELSRTVAIWPALIPGCKIMETIRPRRVSRSLAQDRAGRLTCPASYQSAAAAAEGATQCLAHNLLCNPHYVVFSAIWPVDICCPARPQFTFLRVVWPVPGSFRLVGIHDNAFNGACLQRLFFEFAALSRAQV
jgi:hypothetical protein